MSWGDDILHSLDLEYHNVNPETSLYYGLEQSGMIQRETTNRCLFVATMTPTTNTRTKGRGIVIDKILSNNSCDYVIDWELSGTRSISINVCTSS